MSRAECIVLLKEAIRRMDIINEHLRRMNHSGCERESI